MDKKMALYILKRILLALLTLLIIVSLTFFIMHAVPGSPFVKPKALSASTIAALNAKYGLDKPIMQQYFIYLGNVVKFDFGQSIYYKGWEVLDLLMQGFSTSVFLGVSAAIVALIIGLILGCVAAVYRGKWQDKIILILSTASVSVPSFVIGVLLLWTLTVWLKIFPSMGASIGDILIGKASFSTMVLPIIALALYPTAYITRLTRSAMLDTLGQDYIRTANANGVSKAKVLFKHALRNSLSPVISYAGPMIAGIVTGSFVVESIFSVPGLGGYFIDSIKNLDYTMIMGTTILLSVLMLAMNIVSDIAYKIIDHRIDFS